jgi:hypothetical protein
MGFGALGRNCQLLGSGREETLIRLSADALWDSGDGPRKDINVLWLGAAYGNAPGIVVRDLSIDGNKDAFPADRAIGGLRIWGSRCEVENVHVTGLRGNRELELESFGISATNNIAAPDGEDGLASFLGCSVTGCEPGTYLTAFYPGYVQKGSPIGRSLILNCEAIDEGGNSHAAFSFNQNTRIEGCRCIGFSNGLYCDTDEVQNVDVSGSDFGVSYAGFHLTSIGTRDGSDPYRWNVKIHECTFRLKGQPETEIIGVLLDDTTEISTAYQDILLLNVRFLFSPHYRPPVLLSARGSGLARIAFNGCTLPAAAVANVMPGVPPDAVSLTGCVRIEDEEPALWPLPPLS